MTDQLDQLRIAGEVIADSARQGLHRDVPSCPGWTLAELVRHVGAVHRWAFAIVDGHLDGRAREMFGRQLDEAALADAVDDQELADWFAAGHRSLVEALGRTAQDAQFWTFGDGPSPGAFWTRRQAHETAIHAIDAQLALTTPDQVAPLPTWFALDGIAEMMEVFVTRPGAQARSTEPRTMLIAPTDDDVRWLVTIGPDAVTAARADRDQPGDATLSGTAHNLYSALWNRSPIEPVAISGDSAVAALWADGVKIT